MKILAHSLFIPTEQSMDLLKLPQSLKRHAPRIWKIAYAAALNAIAQSPTKPESIICGTALGALDETVQFIEKVYHTNMGSPRQFIASVHNSMAGFLALEFGITGSNITVCESNNSLASALVTAQVIPESTVLIIIVDENIPILEKIFESCQNYHPILEIPHEGALALIIDISDQGSPQISATAAVPELNSNVQQEQFIAPAIQLASLLESHSTGTIHAYSTTTRCSSTVTVQYETI